MKNTLTALFKVFHLSYRRTCPPNMPAHCTGKRFTPRPHTALKEKQLRTLNNK
ncbi:hypothetical protein IscW_ISCW008847 [Ixodes scapularis]|uniref:Uncharacterized protein n=1 Tax=Ixodes scapularis TaxID=6945 RepID=B7PYS1_IXOSC|nr:hypothetical protein IscW_ISCW008847 [Ixodes scapularis]|eukprot:XP_002403807.1 hypothetical protein IscW_ISCW008847 [Ixodes scapularis]